MPDRFAYGARRSDACALFSRSDGPRIILVALAYFAANKLALLFPDAEQILAAVWPAAGIGLAALLLSPRRLWPALLAAIFLAGNAANLVSGRPLVNSLGFMTANVMESYCCAWVMARFCGEGIRFKRVREVGALVAVAALVNAGTACLGAGTAALVGVSPFWEFWQTWWVADGLGLLLVTPLALAWTASQPERSVSGLPGLLERASFLILWCLLSWLLFQNPGGHTLLTPRPYMLSALLIWAAFRLGARSMTLALAALAAFTVLSPAVRQGPLLWGGEDALDRLLLAQLFIAFTAIMGFFLVAMVDERRRAVAALEQSEIFNRGLVETASEGVWVLDAHGMTTYVNPTMLDLLGYAAAEMLGADARVFLFPEDLDDFAKRAQERWQGRSSRYERRVRRKDGSEAWFLACSAPLLDASGKISGSFAMFTDITERRQAEAALRRQHDMLASTEAIAHMGSWSWEVDTDTVHWSDELFRIFGLDPAQGAPAFSCQAPLYPAEDFENLKRKAAESMTTGQPFELEFRINRVDGSTRLCQGRGFLETLPGQHPTRLYGLVIDITERRRTDQLREHVERTIRHDLRAPASSAIYLAAMLRDSENLTGDQRVLLGRLESAGWSMLDTLNSTLDLFKIESGQYEVTPVAVDVLGLVQKLKEVLESSGRFDSRRLRIALNGGAPGSGDACLCLGQPNLLRLALQNLVINALEASPPGGTVQLELTAGERCRVLIRNSGAVPAAIRDSFFEKYVTSGKHNGTGIGTYTAKMMLQAQGGEVAMSTSDAADQTEVTVSLPAAP